MRARWYDSASESFDARDRLSFVTLEPYGYAADSPLNAVDASGLDCLGVNLGGLAFGGNSWGGSGTFAVDVSVSIGACTNGDVYASASSGYDVYSPGFFHACYPSCIQNRFVEGAYAGAGFGTTGSTAQTAQDNANTFGCQFYAAGVGDVTGSLTTANGSSPHGPVQAVDSGFIGPGVGLGTATYNTNTFVGNFNVVDWARGLVGAW